MSKDASMITRRKSSNISGDDASLVGVVTQNGNDSKYNTQRSEVAQRLYTDWQSRQPGFESPLCYRFEVCAFSFSARCSSSLTCINEYLNIDGGGIRVNSIHPQFLSDYDASQRSRVGVNRCARE